MAAEELRRSARLVDQAYDRLAEVVNPHLGYVSLLRRHPQPDASAEPIDESSPTRDGPELLVSYSSPGAPKRHDVPQPKQSRSWFEPAKITAIRESRG
ncbi:MAG: hypothetical protein ACK5MT_16935 [Actinomycetales bacterium]